MMARSNERKFLKQRLLPVSTILQEEKEFNILHKRKKDKVCLCTTIFIRNICFLERLDSSIPAISISV